MRVYGRPVFPKFEDDVFHLATEQAGEKFKQFLLPTAETALINFYRDEILQEEELPKKYFAYTPCYRKEAGSYRTQGTRHDSRTSIQQSGNVPVHSSGTFRSSIGRTHGKSRTSGTGLRFALPSCKLAAADCSDAMAKTFDIEVWIPSMNEYKEVSSASNARDYQARRGNIRFKRKEGKKPEFIHTLKCFRPGNQSFAPAIMEQFQQADGSVVVPDVLRKWVGKDVLMP